MKSWFPIALGLLTALSPLNAHAQDKGLEGASIVQLDVELSSGRLSSERLVRFYLDRIARMDHAGPNLHAIIALNPEALAQARALDKARGQAPRGPLYGVPILVKDNIETADAMATTAGSLALANNLSHRDAPLVARLRAAGAIILGKTNLSEWANFRSTHATSGWSAVGGLVRNPYALDRTACGSSSGSAAAVAAGFAAAAVGSETDGSVTCPSAMNGLTGFKPSLGQIPRTHIVPIAHSQDTAGPITRTVADAALMMAVMSGADPQDPASTDSHAGQGAAFANTKAADLHGKRLGVLRFPAGLYPNLDPLYDAALARLRQAGAALVEVKLPDDPTIGADETLVLQTELKSDMAAYLATTPPDVAPRTLADLIAFNRRTPAETRLFDQDLFEQSQATKGLDDPAYRAARERSARLTGPEGIGRLLNANHLDALVAPTTSVAWRVDLIYGDANPGAFATFPAVAGYPHLTVPMGLASQLPAGLSFIGTKWSDPQILALGEAYQQLSPSDPPPSFPTTVDPAP
jgi:amidase